MYTPKKHPYLSHMSHNLYHNSMLGAIQESDRSHFPCRPEGLPKISVRLSPKATGDLFPIRDPLMDDTLSSRGIGLAATPQCDSNTPNPSPSNSSSSPRIVLCS
jgi:hypothetical protein